MHNTRARTPVEWNEPSFASKELYYEWKRDRDIQLFGYQPQIPARLSSSNATAGSQKKQKVKGHGKKYRKKIRKQEAMKQKLQRELKEQEMEEEWFCSTENVMPMSQPKFDQHKAEEKKKVEFDVTNSNNKSTFEVSIDDSTKSQLEASVPGIKENKIEKVTEGHSVEAGGEPKSNHKKHSRGRRFGRAGR